MGVVPNVAVVIHHCSSVEDDAAADVDTGLHDGAGGDHGTLPHPHVARYDRRRMYRCVKGKSFVAKERIYPCAFIAVAHSDHGSPALGEPQSVGDGVFNSERGDLPTEEAAFHRRIYNRPHLRSGHELLEEVDHHSRLIRRADDHQWRRRRRTSVHVAP
jgi:hypothetical protein